MNEINFSAAKVNNSNLESLNLGNNQNFKALLETLYIGKNTIELDVVDSTNNYSSKLISESKVLEGTVVVAHYQNNGKGQRGNVWFSEPGKNLTFSLVLTPRFIKINEVFTVSKMVSLAICNYLETIVNEEVYIKWPNDIYIGNKKVCGILIENQFKRNIVEYSIIGIGINVNQTNFEQLQNVTSLQLQNKVEFDLKNILKGILKHIELLYLQLRNSGDKFICEAYLNNLLFFDEFRKFIIEDEQIIVKITDVLPNGKLKTEDRKGNFRTFDIKGIKFLF